MDKMDLKKYGITGVTEIVYNPSYDELFREETKKGLRGYEKGQLTETGAVNVMTGVYTGRSPKDKFFVMDETTKDTIWWTSDEYKNDNKPVTKAAWKELKKIASQELSGKKLYVVDTFCGANENSRLKIRFISILHCDLLLQLGLRLRITQIVRHIGADRLSTDAADVLQERLLRYDHIVVLCFLFYLCDIVYKIQCVCQIPGPDAKHTDQQHRNDGCADFSSPFPPFAEHHRHDKNRCDDQRCDPRIEVFCRQGIQLNQQHHKGRRQNRV